jgi:acetyl esterase/lipase
VDPRRVGILGFSAGGHLAVSAATLFDAGRPDDPDPIERCSSRPDALVACCAVVTFSTEYGHQGSAENLLGHPVDPGLRLHLSLENRVTPQTPPAFIWHTADDEGVPVQNALLLASALRRHRVPFSLHVFPHGPHGVGLASDHPDLRTRTDLCAAWLADQGWR